MNFTCFIYRRSKQNTFVHVPVHVIFFLKNSKLGVWQSGPATLIRGAQYRLETQGHLFKNEGLPDANSRALSQAPGHMRPRRLCTREASPGGLSRDAADMVYIFIQ